MQNFTNETNQEKLVSVIHCNTQYRIFFLQLWRCCKSLLFTKSDGPQLSNYRKQTFQICVSYVSAPNPVLAWHQHNTMKGSQDDSINWSLLGGTVSNKVYLFLVRATQPEPLTGWGNVPVHWVWVSTARTSSIMGHCRVLQFLITPDCDKSKMGSVILHFESNTW